MGTTTGAALGAIANGLGAGLQSFAQHSAQAAAKANGISAASQAAQGAFNQASANNANSINADSILNQYGYNSGQAAIANDFTSGMWDRAAAWNESMFQKQMEFNAAEAQKQRDWQERMSNTQYQRAIKDLEAAGLNPILAATGGMTAGFGSGSAASASTPSMSGAAGAMASGGLLGANTASEGNYTGQMEYMGGVLGLMSAALSGISTAVQAFATLNSNNEGENYKFTDFIGDIFSADENSLGKQFKNPNTKWQEWKREKSHDIEKGKYYLDRFKHPNKYNNTYQDSRTLY